MALKMMLASLYPSNNTLSPSLRVTLSDSPVPHVLQMMADDRIVAPVITSPIIIKKKILLPS